MKSVLQKLLAATIAVAPIVSLPVLGGCSSHYYGGHGEAYPSGTAGAVVYEPGYYYDAEYYDPAGHFHARHYYYYDGHHWGDRDGVPAGYTPRERPIAHDRHDVHEEHDEHDDHH